MKSYQTIILGKDGNLEVTMVFGAAFPWGDLQIPEKTLTS